MRKAFAIVLTLMIFFSLCNGCIKFDDPPVDESFIEESFESPCSDSLVNNEVTLLFSDGSFYQNFEIDSTNCSADGLEFNFTLPDLKIRLIGGVPAESRTYQVGVFNSDTDARMELKTQGGQFGIEYDAVDGELFVIVSDDGQITYEWCDVRFVGTTSSNFVSLSKGRVVCD
ncbi:MAG: hypothetical protein MK086_08090 [Flavobacteriales bacterium]|nr:hypothetical protein [Flavobacteriales bacterium]